jgi:hypothetical protein
VLAAAAVAAAAAALPTHPLHHTNGKAPVAHTLTMSQGAPDQKNWESISMHCL